MRGSEMLPRSTVKVKRYELELISALRGKSRDGWQALIHMLPCCFLAVLAWHREQRKTTTDPEIPCRFSAWSRVMIRVAKRGEAPHGQKL